MQKAAGTREWLPPAKSNPAQNPRVYGPPPGCSVNHLERIEFDDGRINFKTEEDKQLFAFTNVSEAWNRFARRWQLQWSAALAQWRFAAISGTVTVRETLQGPRRGCSRGNNLALERGIVGRCLPAFQRAGLWSTRVFALDATAKSGSAVTDEPGDWAFSVQARAADPSLDLAERADNRV